MPAYPSDPSYTDHAAWLNALDTAPLGGRFRGVVDAVPPTEGDFVEGDVVVDRTGVVAVCIDAGTPGTWATSSGTYVPQGAGYGIWLLDTFAGATDDLKMAAAFAAWEASTLGGTIILGARAHSFANAWQPMLSSFGGAAFAGKFLRITGAGAGHNGSWLDPVGGTVCDMTYNGAAPAKIDTRMRGTIEIDHIVFKDSSGSSKPFFQTTYTTPKIHDNAFQGSKTAAWDQDAIVLGGTSTTLDGGANAAFQGYGGFVRDNYFDKIRRGVYGRTFCNGMTIEKNTWSSRCGADATAAPIEFIGLVGNTCSGNNVRDNVIEVLGYVYGIKADETVMSVFGPNGFYDPGAGFLACHRFAAGAIYNLVIDGYRVDAKALVSEVGAAIGTNTQITSHQSQSSVFPQPVTFSNAVGVTFSGPAIYTAASGFLIQPAVDGADASTVLALIRRSAAAVSNPGTTIFQVTQDGRLVLGGSLGGNMDFQDAAGVLKGQLTGNGKNWLAAGAGGAMLIDSGSGGSYLTLRHYGVKLLDYLGVNTVTLKVGTGSPEGVFAAPVGSQWFRVDGSAGTCHYVKESGVGATGWVAK